MSKNFTTSKSELNDISVKRKEKFMILFDKVSEKLPVNYRELTKAAGTASLCISDRVEKPFSSEIFFEFCPPYKRMGIEMDRLSGGEKTMAALAFVFTLA